MPFTPFHMGAALMVKPGLNRHFSVITFGITQVTKRKDQPMSTITTKDGPEIYYKGRI
jgi:hypothetical protein